MRRPGHGRIVGVTMAARAARALVVAALAAAVLALPAAPQTGTVTEQPGVTVYLFWGSGCPHCAALRPFLDELATRPGVELAAYEVWYDEESRELYRRVAAAHGSEPEGVPTVFVAGGMWVGDSPASREAIAAAVERCAAGGCPDVAGAVVRGSELPVVPATERPDTGGTVIEVPVLGSHDVGGDSLIWATLLIAFVDGFNPCSLWVLTVLVAMILRTGSRQRLALIGGSYLLTAALVYGLFLVGLFSAFTVVDYAWWIRVGVATFALAFAIVNVKDYVRLGRGVSLTIPDRLKPRIARGARSVALESRALPLVVATSMALAAGVSLLELPCTVGFPVVWTNLLAEQEVATSEYAFLLAAYLVVFLIDELAILLAALAVMRIGRLEERHGRVLKLAGGMLMGVLAVLMLVDSNLLEDLTGAAIALGAAAVLTAAAILLHAGAVRLRPAPEPPPRKPRPRGAHAHRRP